MKVNTVHQYLRATMLLLAILGLSGCSTHPDCLKADMFGHCKQWKGEEPGEGCRDPDFLGFCPRG